MTVTAIWCRHKGDNLIGVDGGLPWRIDSDMKKFLAAVKGEAVVLGRVTYESLPGRNITGSRMFVLSRNAEYELCEACEGEVIGSQKALAGFSSDLYIAGGAEVYQLFLEGKESLKPDIIVDCVYEGTFETMAAAKKTDISAAVAVMEKKYRKITPDYVQEGVASAIWMRKGAFVEQQVLKKLVKIWEAGAEIRS